MLEYSYFIALEAFQSESFNTKLQKTLSNCEWCHRLWCLAEYLSIMSYFSLCGSAIAQMLYIAYYHFPDSLYYVIQYHMCVFMYNVCTVTFKCLLNIVNVSKVLHISSQNSPAETITSSSQAEDDFFSKYGGASLSKNSSLASNQSPKLGRTTEGLKHVSSSPAVISLSNDDKGRYLWTSVFIWCPVSILYM